MRNPFGALGFTLGGSLAAGMPTRRVERRQSPIEARQQIDAAKAKRARRNAQRLKIVACGGLVAA